MTTTTARPTFDFARYMNIRMAASPEFSPDGTRLLFLSNITGVPQVWVQDLDGGWPRQLTYYAERVSGVHQSVDGTILFSMDEGGNEHDALYLMSPNGATVTPLTQDPSSIHRAGPWSPDGTRVAYAVNNRDRRYFDLYLLDCSAGQAPRPRLLLEDNHTNSPGSWSPDGRGLIVRQWDTPSNHDLYLLEVETGALLHLTPHEGDVRYGEAGFSPDGRYLYITTDRDHDFMTPARLEIDTCRIEYLDETPWDAETLSLSRDGTRLAYTHNVDGYSTLRLWDLENDRELPPPPLPPGVIQASNVGGGHFSWSPDNRQIAFMFHSPAHPMDVWSYAPESGELRQVTFSPDGAVPRTSYVTPETVRYPTFDGLQIPGLYFRPPRTEGRLPVVVRVHGGPEGQSRPIFDPITQYLVNRGYAVFLPNVRGSTGYGKAYSHLDDVRNRMDSVTDLAACVDWLVKHGGADRERIAVMGGSYGGFMTLAAVTNYPQLWAAGVDIVGIANWRTFLENTGAFRRKHREAEYGNLEADGDFLDEISPIHKAGEIRAPMIILHGANDPRVPVTESDQITRVLKEHEVPVEYHRYPDEGHGLVKLHNKVHGYTAIGDFLDRHLLGVR